MTMKRTSFRRHNFKKSLKPAANLIFAIKRFTEFFESVQAFGRCRGSPISTGFRFGFGETICNDNLPFATATGSAHLSGGGSGLWIFLEHFERVPYLPKWVNGVLWRADTSVRLVNELQNKSAFGAVFFTIHWH